MKQRIKYSKSIMIFAGLIILAWLLYSGAKLFLPVDISQDYKKVQGIDNIIFVQNWMQQCYKRCVWGLKKTEFAQTDYLENCRESDDSMNELLECIHTDNKIRQSIYSPDKKFILYSEIEYNYNKTGITDDEYCYYRVYEIETDKIITIYQAYKEWYNFIWLD